MKNVYLVMRCVDYEGDSVIDAYLNEQQAEHRAKFEAYNTYEVKLLGMTPTLRECGEWVVDDKRFYIDKREVR